jgi:hypothetical protein
MFFRNIRGYLFIITFLLVATATIVNPVAIYAEDDPASTPAPEQQVEIQDNSATNTDVQTPENTEESSVDPTPPPSETLTSTESTTNVDPTPTPTVEPGVTITNDGDIDNNISSTALAGENSIVATDSASLDIEPDQDSTESASLDQTASIQTDDVISVVQVENTVNSTSINSEIVNQTINLFVDQNGHLDLSNPSQMVNDIITAHPDDPVVNVAVISIDNYSYLANDIVSSADTGGNTVEGEGYAYIQTGDAYSLVSVLNQINFTIVNSRIHLVTINIFGDLNGNIILPDFNSASPEGECHDCIVNISLNNDAALENNIESLAVSGQNSIVTTDSASIVTGEAKSSVNNLNIVNTNLIGVNALALQINNLGTWNGSFIGQNSLNADSTGSCSACIIGALDINNEANVLNNILSVANTGGNSLTGSNGVITTGNAYSLVSLFNFINSNFINSVGFFGFINIFGTWTGDVGEKSDFVINDETSGQTNIDSSSDNQQESSNTQSEAKKDEGGLLTITQSNNVGEYVLPGDTVTFFIETKNIGSGKVYDAVLELLLIKDGQAVGGAIFNLGNIDIGKKIKVTTGLVLSDMAQAGWYIARATIRGTVGEENRKISSSSDSTFLIGSTGFKALSSTSEKGKNTLGVLGTKSLSMNSAASKKFNFFFLLFLADLFAYVQLKIIRQRRSLPLVFARKLNFGARLMAVKTLLL